jgi:dihydroorotate dehydrogenase electron transfer subunit
MIAAPMPRNLEAPLLARESLGGPYHLLTFRHEAVAREARPGQFVMIKAAGQAEPLLRRPFSVLDTEPQAGSFRLLVKVLGPGSAGLAALPAGAPAACLGPLGRPFAPPAAGHAAWLVAGGYGIAPFHFFARELRRGGRGVRVFYGARTAADLKVSEPFGALGVELTAATDDGSLGRTGLVSEAVEEALETAGGPVTLYACGPQAMLRAVAGLAGRRGLPAQVSLDPWMGCGMGTCLGCVVRVRRPGEPEPRWRCACTEGPVFDAREVVWP